MALNTGFHQIEVTRWKDSKLALWKEQHYSDSKVFDKGKCVIQLNESQKQTGHCT